MDEEIAKVIKKEVALGANFLARRINTIRDVVSPSMEQLSKWDFEVEVTKVLKIGAALGFNFNRNEIKIAAIVSSMENKDKARQNK